MRARAVTVLAVVGVLLATLPTAATAATAATTSAATATAAEYPDPRPVTGDTAIHDPTMIRLKDGSYVAYSTHGRLEARVSKDRTHWQRAAVDAFATPPAWWYEYNDTADPWAPEITYRAGTYWLYYSLSSWGSNHSAIGVATSASGRPGTWTDRGKVFTSVAGDAWNAIDPYVVKDDGRLWMAFGSYWSGIRMIRLDPRTGKAHATDRTVRHLATRPDLPYAVEAPAIVKHGAYWYLFNSYDACCSGLNATYKIKVGRATSPTGPYTDSRGTPLLQGGGDLLLAGHGRYIGPGGQSLMKDGGRDVLVHHYYDGEDNGAPKLGLHELRWGADGWPAVA